AADELDVRLARIAAQTPGKRGVIEVSAERADGVERNAIGEPDLRARGVHAAPPLAVRFERRERRKQIDRAEQHAAPPADRLPPDGELHRAELRVQRGAIDFEMRIAGAGRSQLPIELPN